MAEVARIDQHQVSISKDRLADRHDRMANELDDYVDQLKEMQIRSCQMDLSEGLQGQVNIFQDESKRQRDMANELRGEL